MLHTAAALAQTPNDSNDSIPPAPNQAPLHSILPVTPSCLALRDVSLKIVTASLSTKRLLLRRWQPSDHEPFRAINADPRVMQFMPALLTPAESDNMIDRIEAHFDQHGFGLLAAELLGTHSFIGFIGLAIPNFVAPFTPCIEIGWRLAYEHWGRGLATEGARAVLRHAFEPLSIPRLVSFTTQTNLRSRSVMERIGMTRDLTADFEHPNLPEAHPLRPHVLYRIDRESWSSTCNKNSPI
jgi:ribosomal-protein-alanine N-acetyltransferase